MPDGTHRLFEPARTLLPDGSVDENWNEREIVNALKGPTGTKDPIVLQSAPPSAESAASTSALSERGCASFGTPSGTSGAEACSDTTGPTPSSTTTFAWSGEESNGQPQQEISPNLQTPSNGAHVPLIFSAAAFPAKTSPSQASEPDSPEPAAASSTSSPESLTLFDHAGCYSRTYPGCSPRMMVGTSASYLERWPNSGTAWPGGCSTHATSESPNAAVECSLSDVLEETTDPRYMLSAKAATGVLRRASARGRALPAALEAALQQASVRAAQPSPASTRPADDKRTT